MKKWVRDDFDFYMAEEERILFTQVLVWTAMQMIVTFKKKMVDLRIVMYWKEKYIYIEMNWVCSVWGRVEERVWNIVKAAAVVYTLNVNIIYENRYVCVYIFWGVVYTYILNWVQSQKG